MFLCSLLKINLQLIIKILVPLWTVIENIMIVNKEFRASRDMFGGDGAGDVSIDRVVQVRELTVAGEAVVHLVSNSGNVVLRSLKLDWNVHVSPA